MLFVSCRKNRLSDFDFLPRHQHEAFEVDLEHALDVPEEDPAFEALADQLIQDARAAAEMPLDDIYQRADDKHVLVLVHGYRNPYQNVSRAYEQMNRQMARFALTGGPNYGLVIGYLWPGHRLRAGYILAVGEANRAGSHYLPDFLRGLARKAKSIDIETHSLGARVALGALKSGEDFDGKIDNVLLTAAAVDDEVLERNKEFYPALAKSKQIFSYSSRRDSALSTGYRFGDFPEFDAALGFHGTEHPDRLAANSETAYMINCTPQIDSHGGYRHTDEFYRHWKKVLDEVSDLPQFMFLDGTPDPHPGT